MKRKFILGLLVLMVLLFYLAQSWALDWKRARQQYYEHPWQDVQRISPMEPTPLSPSTIKFTFVLWYQNVPVLVFWQSSSTKVPSKPLNPKGSLDNTTVRTTAAK